MLLCPPPRGGARSGGGGGGRPGRGGRPQVCYNCGQEGHISAECPNPKVEGGVKKCYNCGELGHISADCPQPKKEREPKKERTFINDTVRNDFHRRFLSKYIK